MEALGHAARLEEFPLERVEVLDARISLGDATIPALPLFDGGFPSPGGVPGTAGSEIPIIETTPAGPSPELDAARQLGVAAVIAVTGRDDEIAPRNADAFIAPWGPPVLQVAPAALPALRSAIESRATITAIASIERQPVEAFNVIVDVTGTDKSLKPLVVMTPRSGWGPCASERGGGLVCWLAVLQSLLDEPPARTVHFVATSGHEVGHIGLEDYIERRLELPAEGHLWLHLGANIGAAKPRRLAVRASDAVLAAHAAERLEQALPVGADVVANPPGPVLGEAANIADHGGRFLSFIAANDAFHLPSDCWPGTVNVEDVAAVAGGVVSLVRERAGA